MPERVPIPAPPIRWASTHGDKPDNGGAHRFSERDEWTRKVAQAVIEMLKVRPTGIFVSNSPTQISADADDYEHGQVDVLRVDATSGPHTFTGFDAQGFSPFWLLNVGSNTFNVGHQNTNSATTNRVVSKTGSDVAVAADASALLWYDDVTTRWRILGE